MEQRKRVNASQGAKGEWKLDATVEMSDGQIVANEQMAGNLIELIKSTEAAFRADGRKIAGDQS
jgi:hypothetical protein